MQHLLQDCDAVPVEKDQDALTVNGVQAIAALQAKTEQERQKMTSSMDQWKLPIRPHFWTFSEI